MTVRVAGVDGARGRWLVATVIGHVVTTTLVDHFADVVAHADEHGLEVVGVDMPIGLAVDQPRTADVAARELLGARRSTLFPTPCEVVLDALDYPDACARSRSVSGKALSKQAFHLMPMVRQIRDVIHPDDADRFVEVHPESSYVQLAGDPLPSKKTAAGVGRRLEALRALIPALDAVLSAAPEGCAIDDVLDALVITWSAARFARGEAQVFGSGTDTAGFPQRIVA